MLKNLSVFKHAHRVFAVALTVLLTGALVSVALACASPETESEDAGASIVLRNVKIDSGVDSITLSLKPPAAFNDKASGSGSSRYYVIYSDNDRRDSSHSIRDFSVSSGAESKVTINLDYNASSSSRVLLPKSGLWAIEVKNAVFKKAPKKSSDFLITTEAKSQKDVRVIIPGVTDEENAITFRIKNGGLFAKGSAKGLFRLWQGTTAGENGSNYAVDKLIVGESSASNASEAAIIFEEGVFGEFTVLIDAEAFASNGIIVTSGDISASSSFVQVISEQKTSPVSFGLRTPAPGGGNTVRGGLTESPVTVQVKTGTSVVELAPSPGLSSAQHLSISDRDIMGNDSLIHINTDSISSGGTRSFTATLSEAGKGSREYLVTIYVGENNGGDEPSVDNLTNEVTVTMIKPAALKGNSLVVQPPKGSITAVIITLIPSVVDLEVSMHLGSAQTLIKGDNTGSVSLTGDSGAKAGFRYSGGDTAFTLVIEEDGKTSRTYSFTITHSEP